MDNGTKVCHFLQDIKGTELKAVVNVVQAKPERYGTEFDTTIPYLSQIVTKKPFSAICLYCRNQQSADEA